MALKGFASGLLCALVLAGCGGGDSDSATSDRSSEEGAATTGDVQASTGYFVDAPVKGLSYRTETLDGTTDALGRFNYLPGETIRFSVGGTELGSAEAAGLMTPGSLDEAGQWDGTRAINIARLLITLDADQNPLNGIVIDDDAHSAFTDLGFDLSLSPSQLNESSVLREALENAGRVGLVSVDYARDHLLSVAEQLPETPTEADIIALLDTGPNYSGRQTPMTSTPDNLRRAAQVFWADPANPAPDLFWVAQLFDPQMLMDVLVRYVEGFAQPPGIRVSGDVEFDDNGAFESASLLVSFSNHSHDGRVYNGSVVAEILPNSGYYLEYLPENATETTTVKIEAFEYGLYYYNLRASGSDGSIGIHGWQSIVQTVDNPYAVIRDWSMDATVREVFSDRAVRLVVATPMGYQQYLEGLGANYGLTTILDGRADVIHSSLGAFTVDGRLSRDDSPGTINEADLEFFRADGTPFGRLTAVLPPASEYPEGHVLSETLSPASGQPDSFEHYKLAPSLTSEPAAENSAP